MVKRIFSECFARKLARYRAAKKKAKARRRKQRERGKLRAVLAIARVLLKNV
jgi:hypothetical protein